MIDAIRPPLSTPENQLKNPRLLTDITGPELE
jgi:hypothetical protein